MLRPNTRRDDIPLLLTLLSDPRRSLSWDLDAWDLAVRRARMSDLLGVVRYRLERAGVLQGVPPPVIRHLDAARNLYLHRRQMGVHAVLAMRDAFADVSCPLVLLKGAGYTMQGLPMSLGRLFNDVDIMVPRDAIDDVERRLQGVGWKSTMTDPYDQRYYRDWSHEIPPMEHPRFSVQLDVHHTILPVTGRVTPDAARLFDRSVGVPGGTWRVLHPSDQVLHAAAHLVQDSEFVKRFREIVDIDGLIRDHMNSERAWDDLVDSAERHALGRCLGFALRYCVMWLGTPIPSHVQTRLDRHKPPDIVVAAMDHWVSRALFGPHPDAPPSWGAGLSGLALKVRAMWIRMPLPLLLYHGAMKSLRSLRRRPPTQPTG